MIKEKMLNAINDQINAEQYSALLYLSMSAYFFDKGLPGFANWMYIQYQEELTHANKFFNYVNERSGKVTVKAIEQMPTDFDGVIDVFEKTLVHEQKVTSLINNLVDISIEEKDHATQSFLKWFVDEQVEEEASADEIVKQLQLMENAPGGLYLMDKELGQRVFTPPAATA